MNTNNFYVSSTVGRYILAIEEKEFPRFTSFFFFILFFTKQMLVYLPVGSYRSCN